MPQFNFEVKGLYGLGNAAPTNNITAPGTVNPYTPATTSGDCNPADVLIDLISSGNNVTYFGNNAIWNHGLGFSNLPAVNVGSLNVQYSRFGGLLKDPSTLYAGGSNLGLSAVRNYCMAYNIFVSNNLDSQQTASNILDDLCEIANCAAVWDGTGIDFIPYCEVSAYGNGTSYVAPTASGPLFNLTSADFLEVKDAGPVMVDRSRSNSSDNSNSLPIQYRDRGLNFNVNSITVSDQLDISIQGYMPGSQKAFDWINDAPTAQAVGWALLRRSLLVKRKVYKFGLPARWGPILTPMDLVTLSEPTISADPIPVRLTKITENEDYTLSIEAEPFIYGASLPAEVSGNSTSGGGNPVGGSADPGSVSTPIFIEIIPALSSTGLPQIWISASGNGQYYGGCSVWLSTDGGTTYNSVAVISGSQTAGTTGTYPLRTPSPDTVDTLFVDLTSSLGTLTSVNSQSQNLLDSLCYLQGGGTITVNGQTLTIPYELVAYGTVSVAGTNTYNLSPPILRGVLNTPIAAHSTGSHFSFLKDGKIVKLDMPSTWVGTTLYFKFTAYNIFGQNQQSLSAVSAYTFTPTGQVGFTTAVSYVSETTASMNPLVATVYQGKSGGWAGIDTNSSTWTDPTKVYFPPITTVFSNGVTTTYAARDSGLAVFTNTAGGQTAYVTIYDPTMTGEPSGTATLSAFADLSTATHWNSPGYIRIGQAISIQYASGGGGGTGGGGGSGSTGAVYDIVVYFPIVQQTASQEIFRERMSHQLVFPANFLGSGVSIKTTSAGSPVFTVNRITNGTPTAIGTITFTSATNAATFATTSGAAQTLNPNDELQIVGPATPDASLSNFNITLTCTRYN